MAGDATTVRAPALLESRNLITDENYAGMVKEMCERLFDLLDKTDGMKIPLQRDRGSPQNLRSPEKKKAADFPPELTRQPARPRNLKTP